MTTPETTPVPELRVMGGNPTDEELAVLVTVIAALNAPSTGGRRPGDQVSTAWNSPSRRMRPVVRRGYRAWRRNALPH